MTDAQKGTIVGSPRIDAFHRMMLERASQDNSNRADEISQQQAERIFAAETLEEILAADAGGTVQMRDVPGTEWRIRSFAPIISNRINPETGQPLAKHGYYVSCDATFLGGPEDLARRNGLTIGESYALQTGADLVIYKLRALEAGEFLPLDLMVVGLPTQSGNTVIKLTGVPKRAKAGKAE